MTNKPMSRIYDKISKAGFNTAFINKLLPSWWDDGLADTPSGRQYASLHLARVFSLSPESLKDSSDAACFNLGGNHRFKHRVNLGEEDLNVATAVAYSAARIVAENFRIPFNQDLKLSWQTIRQDLLKAKCWVDLPTLVQFCHSVGIPVVYIKNFPKGAAKMAGLALSISGRPVIVLSQVKTHGYMLFDLAHELGHIAMGHLNDQNGGVHVDRKIEAQSTDNLEVEANRFAFGLVGGKETLRIAPTRGYLTGPRLADAALSYGKEHGIEPTHVALNYGHNLGHWGVAVNAVKIICSGQPSDQIVVNKLMMSALDEETINEDDLEILTALCGG
ncbi:TPA: ImmA/IrrE family metallo-endopeptidase [Enterobacter hormaechei subsp. hoffmannii]